MLRTEGELKPESTSSEVAAAITSSWSKGVSDFAAGGTVSKVEADNFAQALNYYAGSYAIKSAERVHKDTKGTVDEAEPWKHKSFLSGESYNNGNVQICVKKGNRSDLTMLSFALTEGSDKVTHPISLEEYVATMKTDVSGERLQVATLSKGQTPLAAADIYVPEERRKSTPPEPGIGWADHIQEY